MLAKLKKAYVNFTLTFAMPLLIVNGITDHYSAWWNKKLDDADALVACRNLADKGLGTREECQKEFDNRYQNFIAEDIIEKELWDPFYNHISMNYVQPIHGWYFRRTGSLYNLYRCREYLPDFEMVGECMTIIDEEDCMGSIDECYSTSS